MPSSSLLRVFPTNAFVYIFMWKSNLQSLFFLKNVETLAVCIHRLGKTVDSCHMLKEFLEFLEDGIGIERPDSKQAANESSSAQDDNSFQERTEPRQQQAR